jgi:hypothetical protein
MSQNGTLLGHVNSRNETEVTFRTSMTEVPNVW